MTPLARQNYYLLRDTGIPAHHALPLARYWAKYDTVVASADERRIWLDYPGLDSLQAMHNAWVGSDSQAFANNFIADRC